MLSYLIIFMKLLFVGMMNTVMTYIAINGTTYIHFIDEIYFAFTPTSWFVCLARAYDEKYALIVITALIFIILLWLILSISMIIGLLSKNTRAFAIKMSCIVLFIDVVAALFVTEGAWKFVLISINFVFFICTLISLKKSMQ